MGIELTPQERLEVFGTTEDHTAEAEQRWGDTEAYQESQRRARAYRKEDWVRFRTESDDLEQRLASALEAGTDPLSTTAMDLAEEHRQQVCTWFYDCPPAVHRSLGEMYVEDERFTAHYEQLGTGLARWVRDAWGANAVRQEGIASR